MFHIDLPNIEVVGKLDILTMRSLRPQCVLCHLSQLCDKSLSFAFLALILLLAPQICRAQKSQDWLPVTAQDLKINSVPGDPGAAAIQLYYADYRDDNRREQFIYHRIKVLREEGKHLGDVEVPVPPEYSLSSLQARTVHPDGTIINAKDKPLDRLISRDREGKLTLKVLSLPAITVGSIIEYKYSLTWENHLFDSTWMAQHSLYTVKENFWLGTYKGKMTTHSPGDQTHLSFVSSHLPSGASPRDNGNGIELQLENVPAFKPEKYMPPEDNFKAEVHFFYGGSEIESPEIFWQNQGRDWYDKAERFIGDHPDIRNAAGYIIGGETNAEQKLRKLYARVQQIRNLSYERKRSRLEEKKEALKTNNSVADVLARGYGSENEITELFLALARSAGFEGRLLRAPSRKDRVFDSKLLSEKQLEKEIVSVAFNDADIYLDPGTRFCPFRMVPWMYTSVPALKLSRDHSSFVLVPTDSADHSITRRIATGTISAQGLFTGDVIVEFKGNLALEHRLAALETDDPGRQGDLEEELRNWLPGNSVVHLKEAQGWESSDEPLLAFFAVEVRNFAAVTGRRILMPATLFHSSARDEAFLPASRQYPIYFPYTFEELDNVTAEVPDAYTINVLPKGQDIKLSSTRFVTSRSAQGKELVQTRALVVNSIYFDLSKYLELRAFFGKLRNADEEQTVLETK